MGVDKATRQYVRSLVRQDIRKKERGLAKFTAKPGQSADEAAAVRAKFEADLAFRRDVYEAL